uniref:CSD domain-containing protein n=1 Tax=Attheya septentrionalis TaxID=420275 RepID=A0A6T7IY63_9STRA|mmetsp:Transcript_28060/g.51107  ORF Transcript_28060/g.51107 Transcript_28060/m.51107 type:complete len:1398 (+) Transcript_28060:487-4680(+)
MTEQQSMGERFNQNRSAARNTNQQQQDSTQQQNKKPSSFLEIQEEQNRTRAAPGRHTDNEHSSGRQHGGYDDYNRGRSFGNRDSDNFNRGASSEHSSGRQHGGYDDYNRGRSFGNRDSDNFNRGDSSGGRRGGGRNAPNWANYPVERGCISTLLDNFGFIYGADRPIEVFFHYSEVSGVHQSDLQIDDEVEFHIGPSSSRGGRSGGNGEEKFSAYNVKVLERGTVVWEDEDEPGKRFTGHIDRPIRSERRGGKTQMTEGTIRFGTTTDDEKVTDKGNDKQGKGPLIRFMAGDYEEPAKDDDNSGRRNFSRAESSSGGLGRNDLVEFSLVTDRRTKQKYARNINLLESERERLRRENEKKMLEKATLEKGIVVTLKGDFGLLKSTKRREEVLFKYSDVILPDDDDKNEFVLKEGQEMEFLVLTEESTGGRGKQETLTARDVKFLPAGSVIFHKVLATGVTGIVAVTPQPSTPPPLGSDKGNRGGSAAIAGKVRLCTVLPGTGNETEPISEVSFDPFDSPGGSFNMTRDGSQVGVWIREGDTILFDVVMDYVDGTCRVAPTKCLRPIPCDSQTTQEKELGKSQEVEKLDKNDPVTAVRLIAPSLAGRTEGVISAIRDNYGFIRCAERPVDAYFRLYELLPAHVQRDLRRNMPKYGNDSLTNDVELSKVEVGMSVAFDLSLQGMIATASAPSSSRGRNRNNNSTNEKENLKGRRIEILPPSFVEETKVLVSGMKGVVNREDPKQNCAGYIDLDTVVKAMSFKERYPQVSELMDGLMTGSESQQSKVIFHDILSPKDELLYTTAAEMIGNGRLIVSHIPALEGEFSGHPGRLCIERVPLTTASKNGKLEAETKSDSHNDSKASNEEIQAGAENGGKPRGTSKKEKNKKSNINTVKSLKSIRYDRHCLSEQSGLPPGKDDVITCDIVQSRRTGVITVANVKVVERKAFERGMTVPGSESTHPEESSSLPSRGAGIVTEVVTTRQFGFISVLDDSAEKRENVFFHMKSIISVPSESGHTGTPSKFTIRKGDEAEFDIEIGKNGKQIAINIAILPQGTLNIPVKPDTHACEGYILLEPSNTSLANTPSHSLHGNMPKASSGGGRWDKVVLDDTKVRVPTQTGANIKEEGRILLLSDPTNLFRRKAESQSETVVTTPSDDLAEPDTPENEDVPKPQQKTGSRYISAVGTHCGYKTGAVALRGAGASTSIDGSGAPRRGDLVSFTRTKQGRGVRDIRVIKRGAATLIKGHLDQIVLPSQSNSLETGTAKFIAATDDAKVYEITLNEIVSCDLGMLKKNETVEGILHEGKIHGISRTADLYLVSKISASGKKERPRLNLTVKKELQGLGKKIMAQSGMAKGPDETNGFVPGWTKRVSPYATTIEPEILDDQEGAPHLVEEETANTSD